MKLATTALRASAARSGSRGIRHFKITFWNPKVLEIVLEDRCWGGGVRVYQEIILLLSSKHMQIFYPSASAPPPLPASTFSKRTRTTDVRKNRISRIRIWIRWFRSIRGRPWGPKRSIEAKKAKNNFPEKPDFPDPDEPDPYPVLRERWGSRGLPVAKISDL